MWQDPLQGVPIERMQVEVDMAGLDLLLAQLDSLFIIPSLDESQNTVNPQLLGRPGRIDI